MRNEIYLVHYVRQSCGDVKIAEYACESIEAAESMQQSIRAAYPRDELRFEIRAFGNTATLLKEIRLLQGIQKAYAPTHLEWKKASALLAPRFAEMARRVATRDAEAMDARV